MTSPWRRISAVTSALLLVSAAPAAGQGFTVTTPDSSARITFGGRVQTIFNTTSVDDLPGTETELRRVRLEATLQFGRFVIGKIQPEFAGPRVILKDAYVRFNLDPAFQVWAGQAHRPFGVISPASTVRNPTPEKGLRISGVLGFEHFNLLAVLGYSERDVGIQLRGEPAGAPLGLSYAAGIFNGPARVAAPEKNTYQVVARVAARPVGWARVGVSWSGIDFTHEPPDDVQGLIMTEGAAWEADVELGSERGGPRAVLEVARGDSDPLPEAEFVSAQGFVTYRTGRVSSTLSAIEPLLRVSWADPDVDDDAVGLLAGGTLVTPGVNLWLGGLNRFGLYYELWNPDTGESARSFKALFQLAF
jgi:hypothetical protein